MTLTAINQRIPNPVTGTAYRLMADDASWRITRSVPCGEAVTLTHLRGCAGVGPLPFPLLARFLDGGCIDGERPRADRHVAMRMVILTDFLRTDDALRRSGATATHAFVHGRPGMRAGSSPLRGHFERTSRDLHQGRLVMATAWRDAFGEDDRAGVPFWMPIVWRVGCEPWDRQLALAMVEGASGTGGP